MKLYRCSVALMIGSSCWGQGTANLPAQSQSETSKTWQTGIGMWNGRFWKTLADNQKLIFVFGYSNGANFVVLKTTTNFPDYKEASATLWPSTLTYEEIKLALDRFYDTPENGPVSISGALQVIAARAKGTSEDLIQKFVVELRAAASKL